MVRTLLLLLTFVLVTCPAQARDALTRRLDAIVSRARLGKRAVTAITVRRVRDGAVLYERKGDRLCIPASNQKLLTTGTALVRLGPDFLLRTTCLASDSIASHFTGDLIIRGGADPSISTRRYSDPRVPLRDWVRHLKTLGLKRIAGDLVADDRLFDRVRVHPTWPRNQLDRWYCAPVSALTLNDSCFDVTVEARDGALRLHAVPPTERLDLVNDMNWTGRSRSHLIVFERREGGNRIRARGRFYRKAGPFTSPVAMGDPALVFADAFRLLLEEAGIRVEGSVRLARSEDDWPRERPIGIHERRLAPALAVINKRSQNLHAEILWKLLGAELEGEGSWAGGQRAVETLLIEAGLAPGSFELADGSGMSRKNRITTNALTTFLVWMAERPAADRFIDSLARPAREGTLRRRLRSRNTKDRVWAKTGTLRAVSALSGYAEPTPGNRLAFSIIVNDTISTSRARRLQDQIVEALFD